MRTPKASQQNSPAHQEKPAALASPLSPFLYAKYASEMNNFDEAVRILNTILSPVEGGLAVYIKPTDRESWDPQLFDHFLIPKIGFDNDRLLIPFADIIAKLWQALPAQYLIHVLESRQGESADLGQSTLDLLYQAVADGLVSDHGEDHDRLGMFVVRSDDFPHLGEKLHWGRFGQLSRQARIKNARQAFGQTHPGLIANLVLDELFHRHKIDPLTIIDKLTRFHEDDPELYDLTARTLAAWANRSDADELARVGLRQPDGSRQALASLAQALDSHHFDEFAALYAE